MRHPEDDLDAGTTVDESAIRPPSADLLRDLPVIAAVCALVFGLLSGARWPNTWAVTHMLFDYETGFTKRALFGEILSGIVGNTVTYATLATVAFGLLAAWMLLLGGHIRSLARRDRQVWLAAALLFVSPGFVQLLCFVGYMDHFGLLIALGCLWLPADIKGLAARLVACTVAVLVHEGFFLTFFAAIVFQTWLAGVRCGMARPVVRSAMLVGAVAVVTAYAGTARVETQQQQAVSSHLATRAADFKPNIGAVRVLFRDGGDNRAIMSRLQSERAYWSHMLIAAVFFLPLALAFGLVALTVVRRQSDLDPFEERIAIFGVVVSVLSPLALNIFAWDSWRFFALTHVSGWLVLLAVRREFDAPLCPEAWRRPAAFAAAGLAVLSAATMLPIAGPGEVAKPPYRDHIRYWHAVSNGGEPFGAPPENEDDPGVPYGAIY